MRRENRETILCFVGILWAAFLWMIPESALAWGAGHITCARILAERLPAPYAEQLRDEKTAIRFQQAALFPDGHQPLTETEFGSSGLASLHAVGVKRRFDLHSGKGRCAVFSLLVRAMHEGDDDRARFLIAALSHSIEDQVSCNHDPFTHVADYGWGSSGMDLGVQLTLDASWLEKTPWGMDLLRTKAKEMKPDSSLPPPDAVLLRLMTLEMEGTWGFRYGAEIVRASAAWAATGRREEGEPLARCLAALSVWGVENTLNAVRAAHRFARAGVAVPFGKDEERQLTKRYQQIRNEFFQKRALADDGFIRPFLADTGAEKRIGIAYEPLGTFGSGFFGWGDRTFAAQIAGTLQARGEAIEVVDVRKMIMEGLDAKRMPVLVVPAVICRDQSGYRAVDFLRRVRKYREAGGKVLWIGGNPGKEVAPEISSCLASVPGKDQYCKPVYLTALNQLRTSTVTQIQTGKTYSFQRIPVGRAGWFWHGSPWYFSQTNEVIPLVQMTTPERTWMVAGIVAGKEGRASMGWMARLPLTPFVLTKEIPRLYPDFSLRLDTVGETLLMDAVRALRADKR